MTKIIKKTRYLLLLGMTYSVHMSNFYFTGQLQSFKIYHIKNPLSCWKGSIWKTSNLLGIWQNVGYVLDSIYILEVICMFILTWRSNAIMVGVFFIFEYTHTSNLLIMLPSLWLRLYNDALLKSNYLLDQK